MGESVICQPYFNNPDQTSYVMYFEYLTEWLNNKMCIRDSSWAPPGAEKPHFCE